MATVTRLSSDMIESCLRDKKINYWIDSDHDIRITFNLSNDADFSIDELNIIIRQSGKEKEILLIQIVANKKIPTNLFAKAMLVCNTWNKEKRWPKAYLFYEEGEQGIIILENQMDFEKGVHQELLYHYIELTINSGVGFWLWIKENNHL